MLIAEWSRNRQSANLIQQSAIAKISIQHSTFSNSLVSVVALTKDLQQLRTGDGFDDVGGADVFCLGA